MLSKPEMRRQYLEIRNAIPPEAHRSKSDGVRAQLLGLPEARQAREALVFVSSKDNEIDTHGIIEGFLARGCRVLVPLSEKGGVLAWAHILGLDELAPGRYGILEPPKERRRVVEPTADAFVVVPGIAFTRDGYRIGYGGGYYDRFLAGHGGPTAGIAFDELVIEGIPVEAHDVPVRLVVTDTRVYRRGS